MGKKVHIRRAARQLAAHVKYPPSKNIVTRGDELEQRWADRAIDRIPYYVSLWETYIGNDGTDHALPAPRMTENEELLRRRLWERCYTLFESMALCWSLEEKLILQPDVNDIEAYQENLHRWMAFFANLGRIRDMAKKVGDILRDDSLLTPFSKYYESRNIVLHGPKVPMKMVGNFLTAPELGETRGSWNDKRTLWRDLDGAQFKVLADVATDTIVKLEPIVNDFFHCILKIVETQFKFRPLQWPQENLPAFASAPRKFGAPHQEGEVGAPAHSAQRTFGSGISPAAEAARSQLREIDPT